MTVKQFISNLLARLVQVPATDPDLTFSRIGESVYTAEDWEVTDQGANMPIAGSGTVNITPVNIMNSTGVTLQVNNCVSSISVTSSGDAAARITNSGTLSVSPTGPISITPYKVMNRCTGPLGCHCLPGDTLRFGGQLRSGEFTLLAGSTIILNTVSLNPTKAKLQFAPITGDPVEINGTFALTGTTYYTFTVGDDQIFNIGTGPSIRLVTGV